MGFLSSARRLHAAQKAAAFMGDFFKNKRSPLRKVEKPHYFLVLI